MKALTASFVVVLLGCGPATQQGSKSDVPPGTFTITAEQIEKSGARTAWQVLKHQAPMLQTRDDGNGRPASLGRRGRASLYLDDSPAIVLDGVRVPDFRALEDIDAQSIFAIRSEEHTSELQSRFDLVCRLLLENKKETAPH